MSASADVADGSARPPQHAPFAVNALGGLADLSDISREMVRKRAGDRVAADETFLPARLRTLLGWSPSVPLPTKRIYNGQFAGGNLAGWDVTGPGTAVAAAPPSAEWGGDSVASLTTGSPVTISQPVSTPEGAFAVTFNYQFTTTTGELQVLLGGQVLDTLTAPLTLTEALTPYSLTVSDPSLMGQSGVLLALTLDGPAGSNILVDGIEVMSVPEPAALSVLALAVGGLVWVRPRRDAGVKERMAVR